MTPYLLPLAVCAGTVSAVCAAGHAGKMRNARALRQLKIRVNVNGIRGKSTVTRLLTAALREAGIRTVGKTTGTAARLLLPDGSEQSIRRNRGGASIGEQLRVISSAARSGADALICECMAVNPSYQRVFQHKILRANLTVICNVLEDHLDEMGPTKDQIAWAFASTIPYRGTAVVPADCEYAPYFRKIASLKKSRLVVADESLLPEGYAGSFGYLLFDQNCALALAAAEALGVDRETALRGMRKAAPDPGALEILRCCRNGVRFTAVCAFAANEPASTLKILETVRERIPAGPQVVLMNCRQDRADRTRQFDASFFSHLPGCVLAAAGSGTAPLAAAFRSGSLPTVRDFLDLEGQDASSVLSALLPHLDGALLLCAGNIHGLGEELLPLLESCAKERSDD